MFVIVLRKYSPETLVWNFFKFKMAPFPLIFLIYLSPITSEQKSYLNFFIREEHSKQPSFVNHLEKSDLDFFRNLRVRKETFQFLLTRLTREYNPHHKGGREPTSLKTTPCVTLWYLGNSETFREIA